MNDEILALETSIANSLDFHDKIIAINKLGWKLRSIDTIRGISISQQALDLANKHDFRLGKANAHCNLGRCFVITGQHDLALKHALESIDLFEPLNDANGLTQNYSTLSQIYWQTGDFARALDNAIRFLGQAQTIQNRKLESEAFNTLALVYLRQNEMEKAQGAFDKALTIARQVNDPRRLAMTLNNLAMLYHMIEEHNLALKHANEAKKIADDADLLIYKIATIDSLARAYLSLKKYDLALEKIQQALTLAQSHSLERDEYEAYFMIGKIYQEQNLFDKAINHLKQALVLAEKLEMKQETSECHRTLASIHESQGNLTQALTHFKKFHTLYESVYSSENNKKINLLEVVHRTETARKQAELQHVKNEELQQHITELQCVKSELQQAKEMAESANQAKDDFLSKMSHELRSPLTSILLYAQLLKRPNMRAKSQEKGLNIIEQCGQQLLDLINDMLDISKIEVGKFQLNPVATQLPLFLDELINMMRLQIEQQGVVFSCHVDKTLPKTIQVDSKRLRQVLINLLNNAFKFTKQGQITLSVTNLKQVQEYATIRFEVVDTGHGISAQDLSKIFLPFEQSDLTRATGTGLGLTISQHLVKAMGGELQVKSRVNKGSCFWFDLDFSILQSIFQEDKSNLPEIIGYKGRKQRILIVDDIAHIRSSWCSWLESVGFEVTAAQNGQQGLEIATAIQPDVIITDLIMPTMTGLEMTQHIKQLSLFQHSIIIIVSANATEEAREQSLQAGCDAFLLKPVDMNLLLNILKEKLKIEWLYAS